MRRMQNGWIALALILALLLAGCGGEQEDVSGKVTPHETQAVTEAPAETAAAEETPVSLGRIEGGVYTNTYAGFGCELDSSWVFSGAEELQELPDNIQELLGDTEVGEAMADMTQILDMKAENYEEMSSINVLYSQLDTQSRLAYALMSEEACVDQVLAQKDVLISSYAQAGIELSSVEKVEVTFLGETHYAVKIAATWDGVAYYTLQLFDYQAGRYGITTTFASFVEDNTENLLSLFYKVD